jgi:hypothetical protein
MRMLLACLILIHVPVLADLDQHQTQGLKDTKQMLTNPKERNEAIKKDKTAQEVDGKVDALTGNTKNKEELYGIASEVMEALAVEAKGDHEKMQNLLSEAQANPKAFYEKYFNGAQKARLKNLASDIEKQGTPAKPKN